MESSIATFWCITLVPSMHQHRVEVKQVLRGVRHIHILYHENCHPNIINAVKSKNTTFKAKIEAALKILKSNPECIPKKAENEEILQTYKNWKKISKIKTERLYLNSIVEYYSRILSTTIHKKNPALLPPKQITKLNFI